MDWSHKYGKDNQPSLQQIADFIQSDFWEPLNNYLQQTYFVEPKFSYSGCSMQPGWNVKYSKSGKSLCTLYPMDGYFIALVVIGKNESAEADLLMPLLTEYVRKVFAETKAGQGAKWLMLDVRDAETIDDIAELIGLRVRPKTFPRKGGT